jgi:hypothetical protein
MTGRVGALRAACQVGAVAGCRPLARHGLLFRPLHHPPTCASRKKAVHLPDVVGAEVRDDLRHPRVCHAREQLVSAVHPGRVDGTLLAARARVRGARCLARVVVSDGQRPRGVASERRLVPRDPELAVPLQDLPRESPLAPHEGARQRPGDAVAVAVLPARPREEARAVRPIADLHVREAELLREDLVLYLLLPGWRHDRVVPGERHPVDEALPLGPAVPYQRVGVRADLRHVRVRHRARARDGGSDARPRRRHEQPLPSAANPAIRHPAVLAQVDANAARELRGGRAADGDAICAVRQREARPPCGDARARRREHELEVCRRARHHTLEQRHDGGDVAPQVRREAGGCLRRWRGGGGGAHQQRRQHRACHHLKGTRILRATRLTLRVCLCADWAGLDTRQPQGVVELRAASRAAELGTRNATNPSVGLFYSTTVLHMYA